MKCTVRPAGPHEVTVHYRAENEITVVQQLKQHSCKAACYVAMCQKHVDFIKILLFLYDTERNRKRLAGVYIYPHPRSDAL